MSSNQEKSKKKSSKEKWIEALYMGDNSFFLFGQDTKQKSTLKQTKQQPIPHKDDYKRTFSN